MDKMDKKALNFNKKFAFRFLFSSLAENKIPQLGS
jgi:hypothetical protein